MSRKLDLQMWCVCVCGCGCWCGRQFNCLGGNELNEDVWDGEYIEVSM